MRSLDKHGAPHGVFSLFTPALKTFTISVTRGTAVAPRRQGGACLKTCFRKRRQQHCLIYVFSLSLSQLPYLTTCSPANIFNGISIYQHLTNYNCPLAILIVFIPCEWTPHALRHSRTYSTRPSQTRTNTCTPVPTSASSCSARPPVACCPYLRSTWLQFLFIYFFNMYTFTSTHFQPCFLNVAFTDSPRQPTLCAHLPVPCSPVFSRLCLAPLLHEHCRRPAAARGSLHV